MAREPQEVKADIEAARERLGTHLETLSDKVTPSKVAERRVDDARRAAGRVREKVMGTAQHTRGQFAEAGGSVSEYASETAESVKDTAGTVTETAKEVIVSAPDTVRRGTEGSPLAAGLVAFGIGMLASSLIPASRPEERAGVQIKDQAGRLAEPLQDSAREVSGQLRPKAQEAAESLRGSAQEAASQVRESVKGSASEVTGTASDAAGAVKETARR